MTVCAVTFRKKEFYTFFSSEPDVANFQLHGKQLDWTLLFNFHLHGKQSI